MSKRKQKSGGADLTGEERQLAQQQRELEQELDLKNKQIAAAEEELAILRKAAEFFGKQK
ncbi:hypothetical protein C2I18_15750 [Paenibacillus sp. PK3_47]|uniref:hypothetical protein n=1 Tax=Paenibacillus sp. PK3_47 TaxID=2072642 RepID=UPI00201DE4CB|nr:hypothetical protein [Paenibacillus sp. PK3_47]UQZ34856.1 hypothetical protein C2I18_15750 [Paenibacillus sp. PK3_47]